MSEKFWGFWIIAIVVLFGWQAVASDYKDVYNMKVVLAAYEVEGLNIKSDTLLDLQENDITNSGANVVALVETVQPSLKKSEAKEKRILSTAFGENDLRYHLKFASGNFVPTTLDFSTNILYNYSYMINTPSKLIHNIKLNFTLDKVFMSGSKLNQLHGKLVTWVFIVWDILHTVVGLGMAFIMLFVGCIFGLLFHPIHSVLNFFPGMWQSVVTTWHALSNLFNLFS
ncbi:hypothetical protein AB4Z30_07860 [Paenibacillus sp. 2TAF8]|uniref:hypothetical protein n=1 Tax=Paenibacillus sp. 2TAF8 TaxID=3233020 RepID=UPI003F9C57E8